MNKRYISVSDSSPKLNDPGHWSSSAHQDFSEPKKKKFQNIFIIFTVNAGRQPHLHFCWWEWAEGVTLRNDFPTLGLKHVTSHIPLVRMMSTVYLATREAVNKVYCAWEDLPRRDCSIQTSGSPCHPPKICNVRGKKRFPSRNEVNALH